MKLQINAGSVLSEIKILLHQGKQFIPDVTTAEVPGPFRGRPEIEATEELTTAETQRLIELCPTGAITDKPVSIDMGKCVFCGECQRVYPALIRFTADYKIASNAREGLIIRQGNLNPVVLDPDAIRKEIRKYFRNSLKLRQVSAGGDNSCEWELNAAGNVNFDMGRYGIEFVASPRHADGIVITGPISKNMAEPLQICYDAVPRPKMIILAGTDAISGGIFAGSPALDRTFIDRYTPDLYIPGNPVHPLTFINGILSLIRGN
jgi:Ni,Fe-hydrogenase III small subunit/ferredoxin